MFRTTHLAVTGTLAAAAIALIGLSTASAPAAPPAAPTAPNAAFERMKTLVGSWKGTAGDMKFEETFRLISGGTAIEEQLSFPDMHEHDMVSVYHPNGDALMLTHYCAENNQPRMTNTGYKGSAHGKGSLNFEFVDVTNLSPGATHMHHVAYEFTDDDHFKSTWTAWQDGKEGHSMVFTLERAH